MAHVTNKFLDPKANCPREYFKENEKVLKSDYKRACKSLGVLPNQKIDSIKVKVSHAYLGVLPENFKDEDY